MPQTPEELTKEWLNNKLQAGSFWFVETEDSNPEPMVVDMEGDLNDYEGNYYRPCFSKGKLKVLAPCDYDELQQLKEENKQMSDLLEMVARGITLDCDTEDVIRITSVVKRYCIAKRESEEQ